MTVETTNSVYTLDTLAKTWKRVKKSDNSGKLRTEEGPYYDVAQLEVGRAMVLICPTIDQSDTVRMVVTSKVQRIEKFAGELSPQMIAKLDQMVLEGKVGEA